MVAKLGPGKLYPLWLALCAVTLLREVSTAGEPPRVVHRVKVYSEPGRFAGWPANHGIWSWGNEVLVGFSRGYDKDNGVDYHIDQDRPEDFLLARSKDGGATWSIEEPNPPGALAGTKGMRHAAMPPGMAEERPSPLREPIDFGHPDFALAVHMQDHQGGASCFYFSYDRGKSWRGPFRLPLFGQKGVMGRTDYLVEKRDTCLLFLTATKSDGTEGRPFSAQTSDGGLTWQFLGFIGSEPRGYAVMPSTVRISAIDLVTAVRLRDAPRRWIDAYVSRDDGRSWSYLSTPAPDIGQGNPPALVRLADGRLCLTYGYRAPPFAIHARQSADQGKTWTDPFILRGHGGSQDIGYPRSVVRPDGKVVTVYAFHDRAESIRAIEATIWDPGRP
jgi:BNR repeat-like domain